MALNIIESYLKKSDCYNSGKRITPIGMQLHTVGTAQNSAQSLADYWNQSGISACVHYCVDAETEGKVLQFLPETYRSWADAGFGNGNLVTVELMESDHMKYTSGAEFEVTDDEKFREDIGRAYDTAVEFFAHVCSEHGWDPTAKLSNGLYVVSSHYEGNKAGVSSSHVDPNHVWDKAGYTMDGFRADVKAAMGDGASGSNGGTSGSTAGTGTGGTAGGSSSGTVTVLDVDGQIGTKTTKRLQEVMGTTVDGTIDGQQNASKKYWTSILSSVCKWSGGTSQVVKALQSFLIGKGFSCGTSGADGKLGKDTAKGLQSFLICYGCTCGNSGADGIFGTNSAKALQRWLNAQA